MTQGQGLLLLIGLSIIWHDNIFGIGRATLVSHFQILCFNDQVYFLQTLEIIDKKIENKLGRFRTIII